MIKVETRSGRNKQVRIFIGRYCIESYGFPSHVLIQTSSPRCCSSSRRVRAVVRESRSCSWNCVLMRLTSSSSVTKRRYQAITRAEAFSFESLSFSYPSSKLPNSARGTEEKSRASSRAETGWLASAHLAMRRTSGSELCCHSKKNRPSTSGSAGGFQTRMEPSHTSAQIAANCSCKLSENNMGKRSAPLLLGESGDKNG